MSFNSAVEAANLHQGANLVRPQYIGDMIALAESRGWRVIGVLPTEFTQNSKNPNARDLTMAAVVIAK